MTIWVIIPVREQSKRASKKALQLLNGKPLIYWVVTQAQRMMNSCYPNSPLVVATDSAEVRAALVETGVLTLVDNTPRVCGTDRVAAAYASLVKSGVSEDCGSKPGLADIVVNLQGDQLNVTGVMVSAAIDSVLISGYAIGTCVTHPMPRHAVDSLSAVRAVLSYGDKPSGYAVKEMYRNGVVSPYTGLHIGVYAFLPATLAQFLAVGPSDPELNQGLEQLRAYTNGMSIGAFTVPVAPLVIDTEEDLDYAQYYFDACQV